MDQTSEVTARNPDLRESLRNWFRTRLNWRPEGAYPNPATGWTSRWNRRGCAAIPFSDDPGKVQFRSHRDRADKALHSLRGHSRRRAESWPQAIGEARHRGMRDRDRQWPGETNRSCPEGGAKRPDCTMDSIQ